jgi:hypothetical protein
LRGANGDSDCYSNRHRNIAAVSNGHFGPNGDSNSCAIADAVPQTLPEFICPSRVSALTIQSD